jgi:calcium-dependent protein kinase
MDQYQKIKKVLQVYYYVVYQASKKSTGELFYLKKIILKKARWTPDQAKKEFDLLKMFDHPNIVKVFDYFVEDIFFYIVEEYLDGGDLGDKIGFQTDPFEESFILNVFFHVAAALFECKQKKVLHLDICLTIFSLQKKDKLNFVILGRVIHLI